MEADTGYDLYQGGVISPAPSLVSRLANLEVHVLTQGGSYHLQQTGEEGGRVRVAWRDARAKQRALLVG